MNLQKWNYQHLFFQTLFKYLFKLKVLESSAFFVSSFSRNSMNFILPSESFLVGKSGWFQVWFSKFGEESHGCELPSELIPHWNSFHGIPSCPVGWWLVKPKNPPNLMVGPDPPFQRSSWICVETHFIWNFSWTENTDVNKMFCWTLIDFSESHLQPMNLLANTCSVSCSRSKVSSLSGSLCFISAFNRCFCLVLLFGFLICPK